MTENEAIELLNKVMFPPEFAITEQGSKMKVVWDMAIQALKEIQQYRAIGTVEEIQQKLKNMSLVIDTDRDLLNRYIAIGTIDEFKALKEKSVAKKPLHNGANWYRCPNGCEVHKKQFEKDWYCPKCGTKIDWSE